MFYIIQILASILIGISVAAILGTRTMFVIAGSVVAIGFAVSTFMAPSWWALWGGVACFIFGQMLHRDNFAKA